MMNFICINFQFRSLFFSYLHSSLKKEYNELKLVSPTGQGSFQLKWAFAFIAFSCLGFSGLLSFAPVKRFPPVCRSGGPAGGRVHRTYRG